PQQGLRRYSACTAPPALLHRPRWFPSCSHTCVLLESVQLDISVTFLRGPCLHPVRWASKSINARTSPGTARDKHHVSRDDGARVADLSLEGRTGRDESFLGSHCIIPGRVSTPARATVESI